MSKLKYIAIATLIFVVSFVGGCCGMDMHLQTADANEHDRMVRVENNMSYRIVKDSETGVHYLFWDSGYGGGLVVMVDAEGKPLVSE